VGTCEAALVAGADLGAAIGAGAGGVAAAVLGAAAAALSVPDKYFWRTLIARMLVLPGSGKSSSSSLLSESMGNPDTRC